ncbi:hypothetical protein A3D04_01105 [Candidatus Curtissbacteria bacterium RIFCSPHIGHO2_02_FULL_40_16b]|uniref:Mur ligase central domain-containing protein n=1 Tax=Candidatus Curtissbacteria bacterium RIFCSPHIGHO2_02_FULL_40_16b TaxID=1797714 RepID=A0A1F5G9Z7_9BACT|nr:MAG: hypothetical protein A3D04_01105 [Candidatus Curtissbacteria bacterium RIFCSPHIGHO2_02_FULL_40_16b]
MFKDYYACRAWLESFIPQTYSKKNLGLERIEYLLKLLGNPEKKFKSVHVGGTSGKGSTAYYIARLLEQANRDQRPETRKMNSGNWQPASLAKRGELQTGNLKVGLHLSPHLTYIGERMQIFRSQKFRGGPIPVDRLISLISQIRPIVESMKASRVGLPSYFEILVAASFKYFAQEKVDFAVVEVGLGGKYDATNILRPQITLITNVGLDHTEILGKTIEKIAEEKAGIIKAATTEGTEFKTENTKNRSATTVVTGATGKALKVIEKVARLASAPLISLGGEPRWTKAKNAPLIKVNTQLGVKPLKSDINLYERLPNDILRYMGKSFAFSSKILAFLAVSSLGIKVKKEVVKQAFEKGLEARLEEIEQGVILDGAHNTDKMRFLIEFIKNQKPETRNQKLTLVVAFKRGKDWKKMLDLLIKNLPVKKVIATEFNAPTDMGFFASVDACEIAAYVRRQGVSLTGVYSNSQEAVFEAINSVVIASEDKQSKKEIAASFDKLRTRNDGRLVLVTGSLYLVGEARTLWKLPEF